MFKNDDVFINFTENGFLINEKGDEIRIIKIYWINKS